MKGLKCIEVRSVSVLMVVLLGVMLMIISCNGAVNDSGNGGTVTGVYICTDGATTRAGSPGGNTNVQACNACNDGYKLTGTANEPNTTCVQAGVYICANGTANAADLGGDTNMQSCNTCNDRYKLTDGIADALNNACVATAFICTNGGTTLAGRSPSGNADVQACNTCDTGYRLMGAATTTTCVATAYTCTDGTPTTGSPGGSTDVQACSECDTAYRLMGIANESNTTCVEAGVYICANGTTARTDNPDGSTNIQACNTCNDGYRLTGTANAPNATCVANVYTCTGGTAATGSPSGNANAQACSTCDGGFKLMGTADALNATCVDTVYTCTNGATTLAGKPGGNADAQACNTCDTEYRLMGTANAPNTTCVGVAYVCSTQPQVRDQALFPSGGSVKNADAIPSILTASPRSGQLIGGNEDVQACGVCEAGYTKSDDSDPYSSCVEDYVGSATPIPPAVAVDVVDVGINGTTVVSKTLRGALSASYDLDVFEVMIPTDAGLQSGTKLVVYSDDLETGLKSSTAGRLIDLSDSDDMLAVAITGIGGLNGGFLFTYPIRDGDTFYPEVREFERNATTDIPLSYSVTFVLDQVPSDVTDATDRGNAYSVGTASLGTDFTTFSKKFYVHPGDTDLFKLSTTVETASDRARYKIIATVSSSLPSNPVVTLRYGNTFTPQTERGKRIVNSEAYYVTPGVTPIPSMPPSIEAATNTLEAVVTNRAQELILQIVPASAASTGEYTLEVQVATCMLPVGNNVLSACVTP